MPIQLEPDWGRSRRVIKVNQEQVTEILTKCHTREDEQYFAKKFGIHPMHVRAIRRGKRWAALKQKLKDQNLI